VHTKTTLLAPEKQLLAILLSILQSIRKDSRWYPVFTRYISQIKGRVDDMGGDSSTVYPDPYGVGDRKGCVEEIEICGRVGGLCYNCAGCFEGFEFVCVGEGGKRRFECAEKLEGCVREWWEKGVLVELVVGRKKGDIREFCVVKEREVVVKKDCRSKGHEECGCGRKHSRRREESECSCCGGHREDKHKEEEEDD